jgi:hypothetical protein
MMEEQLFDKDKYIRTSDLFLPDDVKQVLQSDIKMRTEEDVKHIVKCLNLFVPEFSEFPAYTQRMIVHNAVYLQYEAGRVILRQGHVSDNFYIILFGTALAMEAVPKPNLENGDEFAFVISGAFKCGDYFGDQAIINKSRQPTSIYASGESHIIVLCISKEMFYRIQTPSNEGENMNFMKENLVLLSAIGYPFDMMDSIEKSKHPYFSIYYRPGTFYHSIHTVNFRVV